MYCLHLSTSGPGVGESCGEPVDSSDEEEEEEEDSSSSSEDSTKRSRKKGQVRGMIRGARERALYGRLESVEVECQDGLVCVEVSEDRMECQMENPDGKL